MSTSSVSGIFARGGVSPVSGIASRGCVDETGFVNLVIWQDVFKEHALVARTSNFLGITGQIQSQDGVVHLVADELWKPELDLEPVSGGSRDFH